MSENTTCANWRAVVNGRRSLNGVRHSIRVHGDMECAPGVTIFEAMGVLAKAIECQTIEMEIPGGIQLTIEFKKRPAQCPK